MSNDIMVNMGTHTYIARIEEDEDGIYSVSFPSLPGCLTQGNTLEEAIAMAKEVLEGWVSWLKEEGRTLPPENLPKKKSRINIALSVSV